MLEHHADARTELRQIGSLVSDRDTIDADLALLVWLQSVHALNKSGLARSRRAAHHDHLALGNPGRAVTQDLEVAVPLADIVDLDHALGSTDNSDPRLQSSHQARQGVRNREVHASGEQNSLNWMNVELGNR